MNKSDLIQHITQSRLQKDGIYEQIRPTDVKEAIDRILDTLTEALAENRHIEIRDFGSFDIRVLPARQGRNPKTGESVWVPDKKTVHFKPGHQLRTQVAPTVQHD